MLFTSQTLTKCNANKIPRTIQDKQICTKYILDWLKKTQQDAGMQSKYVHIPYVYILFKLKALCLWNLTFTSPLKNNLFCNSKQFCGLWHFVECLHVSVKKCWRLWNAAEDVFFHCHWHLAIQNPEEIFHLERNDSSINKHTHDTARTVNHQQLLLHSTSTSK